MAGPVFCFGPFRLIARERLLVKNGAPVHLGGRAFDLLLALVERAGETVNREELFDLVWPDVIVSKVNLRVHIALLRKALAEGQDGNRYIACVAGRGYRFVPNVTRFHSDVHCVVDFAGVEDPADVVPAVASALGVELQPGQPLASLLAHLQDKQMLLVLVSSSAAAHPAPPAVVDAAHARIP